MPQVEPVPFRLRYPGSETLNWEGARSVSYRLEGLLHFTGSVLTLEWTGSQRTQQVTWGDVSDDVDHFPVEWVEIPLDWISEVRLKGSWWVPRIVLRGRRFDAFEDVPTSRGSVVSLHIRRRDRKLAGAFVEAVDGARRGTSRVTKGQARSDVRR